MRSVLVTSSLLALAAADGTCGKIDDDVNFPGYDLEPVHHINVTNAGECCDLCAGTSGCKAFSFVAADAPKNHYGHAVCWLKTSDAGRRPTIGRHSGVTVMVPPAPTPSPKPPTPPPAPTPVPGPAPGPKTCETCKGPVWSWDKFPAFFHSADDNGPNGGFSEAALDTIARFPMATLEKWQGAKVQPFMYQEDAWVVAATQIKQRNPDITVVVWYDSLRVYTADKSLNPDLKPGCTSGNMRAAQFLETHPEYLLKNRSGLPALVSNYDCHGYDFTKSYAQSFWMEMCLNMTASGVIDGCGADASWQTGVDQAEQWELDADTALEWDEGHKSMMRQTTEALKDGVLLGKDPWEVGDYVNGALHEGCGAHNGTIHTLQNLTKRARDQGRRLVYQCHSKKGDVNEVAAFLIGCGPYHYYGLGGWHGVGKHGNFSEHWMPGIFDRALGAPLADGVYDPSSHEWSREFTSGTKVKFNAKSRTGEITWGAPAPIPAPPTPTPPSPPSVPGFERHPTSYCGPSKSFYAVSGDSLSDCASKCAADSKCHCFDFDDALAASSNSGSCSEGTPGKCACRLHESASGITHSSHYDAYEKASKVDFV